MTIVYTPPGNMSVTQAVIAVPVGADGITPQSSANPPLQPQGDDSQNRQMIDTLKQTNVLLGALIMLLADKLGSHDTPESLVDAAAGRELRILS